MKPKIDDEIWCIYDGQILLEVVEFLGKESFLIEGYDYKYDPEYCYEDYNKTWWKDLEKAKKEARRRYGRKIKIVEFKKGWWNIEDED